MRPPPQSIIIKMNNDYFPKEREPVSQWGITVEQISKHATANLS